MSKLNQAGDTIVEVLLAMVVVALVLVGAFAASNRSSKSVQQAQEHTVALKIAESQLEILKSISSNSNSQIFTTGVLLKFCIHSDTSLETTTLPCTTTYGGGVTYNYQINRTFNNALPYIVFTTVVNWNSLQGSGQDQVSLSYKVYRP